MITLPISQAATQCGVTEATIRKWVMRGHIEPVRRGAKPLRFHESDLAKCAAERMSNAEHRRLDALWLAVVAQT